jgi:mannose-6-phosphate isomerase-like protein (cupin superfamily)
MGNQKEILDFNPIGLGEQYVFTNSAKETGGELVVVEVRLAPNSPWSGPPHIHRSQEESYEVLSGTLDILFKGQKKQIKKGERCIVPIGTPHTFGNYSSAEVLFISEHRPALRFQQMLEALYEPVKSGEIKSSKSIKALLMQAVVLKKYKQEMVFTNPVLQGFIGILAFIGGALGYKSK